jgi:hypothetical protein
MTTWKQGESECPTARAAGPGTRNALSPRRNATCSRARCALFRGIFRRTGTRRRYSNS